MPVPYSSLGMRISRTARQKAETAEGGVAKSVIEVFGGAGFWDSPMMSVLVVLGPGDELVCSSGI
jgi:hypothetical protein